MTKKALTAALLCALATLAQGQTPNQGGNFTDGNKLLQRCRDANRSYCLGYVAAIADATRLRNCSPSNLTQGQLADVVQAFLEAMPAQRHQDADVLVEAAINTAWPCQTNSRPSSSSRTL